MLSSLCCDVLLSWAKATLVSPPAPGLCQTLCLAPVTIGLFCCSVSCLLQEGFPAKAWFRATLDHSMLGSHRICST